MLQSIVFYTGGLTLSCAILKISRFAYIYLRPSSLPRYHHGPGEPWAIISGSTDGLGFGLGQELCSRGFNVILHGRSATKLAAKAAELERAFPERRVKTFLADALSEDVAVFAELEKLIDGLNVTVLVNNIGGGEPVVDGAYRTFVDSARSEITGMVQFNAGFALQLTRTVLPALQRNAPSLLMTIGSHADAGSAYVATYCGAKALDMAWSRALRAEMQAEGQDVEVIGVVSGRSQSATTREEVSLSIPSARQFAKAALDKVGCGRSVLSAYWVHALQRGFLDSLPESWSRGLLVKTMKKLRDERRQRDVKSK